MSEATTYNRQGAGGGAAHRTRLRDAGAVSGGWTRWLLAVAQVVRTYATRIRFWLFGGGYLLVSWWWSIKVPVDNSAVQVLLSASIAPLVGCFVALHVRRQFATPAAKLLPHFAAVHLAVGAAASLLVWIGVSAVQARLLGLPWWGPVGAHAFAGLLTAAVVCWRQLILMVAVMPIALVNLRSFYVFHSESTLYGFVAGREPLGSAAAIALAMLAHGVAAIYLLRMSDQSASVSDDFAVETAPREGVTGRADELLWRSRDREVRHRLADAGHGLWFVQRWRVPSAISWAQWALAAVFGTLLVLVSWWFSEDAGGAVFGAIMGTAGMLVAPFAGWHARRGTMSQELLRPVTRRRYVLQTALAMALDMCAWVLLASLFLAAVVLAVEAVDGLDRRVVGRIVVALVYLWTIAAFLYGLGLATFRSRYWLPLMLGLGFAWTIATSFGAFALAMNRASSEMLVMWYAVAWLVGGIVPAAVTLYRLLHSDMV